MQNRYTAYTLDGSPIFHAGTAQQIADGVALHLREDRKPAIGYTHDAMQFAEFPYTVWRREDGATVGTPCRYFDDVCKHWGIK